MPQNLTLIKIMCGQDDPELFGPILLSCRRAVPVSNLDRDVKEKFLGSE